MLDRAYLDPAFLATLTWVDWIIIAIPAACVLAGLLRGGTSLMRFGLIRFMVSWPLAMGPVAYIMFRQRHLIDQFGAALGITPVMATSIVATVVFIVALIIIYRVFGLFWGGLRHLLAGSAIGTLIDRLLGIPAGLFVGAMLCAYVAVAPAVQFRSMTPSGDQPPALRDSVLLPMVEEQLRDLARYMPPQ